MNARWLDLNIFMIISVLVVWKIRYSEVNYGHSE